MRYSAQIVLDVAFATSAELAAPNMLVPAKSTATGCAAGASREDVFQGFAGSAEWALICADYGIIK